MVNVVSYRWTHRDRAWTEGRVYSYVLTAECLLFLAQWNTGENAWQNPHRLTPRHHVI